MILVFHSHLRFLLTATKNQKPSNIESQLTLHSEINKPPLRGKIKLLNHLLLQIYLIWKTLLILVLREFHCFTKTYHRVQALPILLMIFWNVNPKTHQKIQQLLLLNMSLIRIIWDQNQHKLRLPQVQDQHQVQLLHYCVNTNNLIHLLLKKSLPIFQISQFHWDILLVLKLPSLFIHNQDKPNYLETKNFLFPGC